MLGVDLTYHHRNQRVIGYKEALVWSAAWIVLALLFCVGLFFTRGSEAAFNFLSGYLIEKALSIDNLFVFLIIFSYFSTPPQYVHKVLFWGVVGAFAMRALFLFTGLIVIHLFHWVIYLFGIYLIITGIQLGSGKSQGFDPGKNPVIKLLQKWMPITNEYHGNKFFIFKEKRRWATPLFVVLIVIETTDILFALDSAPAILAITTDPFIVYTSNIFAILGLRALYFVLADAMRAFAYLHYGLAALLILIGLKMLLSNYIQVPPAIALGIMAIVLAVSVIASLFSRTSNLDKKNK